MATTWMDIIDSAMKIGLGACIGLAGQAYAQSETSNRDRKAELRAKLMECVDKITTLYLSAKAYFIFYAIDDEDSTNARLKFRDDVKNLSRVPSHMELLGFKMTADCAQGMINKILRAPDEALKLVDMNYRERDKASDVYLEEIEKAFDEFASSAKDDYHSLF